MNSLGSIKLTGKIGKVSFEAFTRKWSTYWDWVLTSSDENLNDVSYPDFLGTEEEAFDNLTEWLDCVGAKYVEVTA